MKFYLDECLSPKVGEPLGVLLVGHEFTNYLREGLTGTKDVPLFGEMRQRNVDVFITLDRAQLRDPEELAAIKTGGCHWIGMTQPSGHGISLFARQAASLLLAVAYILDNPPSQLTAYRVKASGRESHQLFTSVRPLDN